MYSRGATSTSPHNDEEEDAYIRGVRPVPFSTFFIERLYLIRKGGTFLKVPTFGFTNRFLEKSKRGSSRLISE